MHTYAIRVAGHIAPRWAAWLGMKLRHENDGTTVFTGELADQSALFGVLTKIRDLNLPLLHVEQIPSDGNPITPPDAT
jgi:hypothetical protein